MGFYFSMLSQSFTRSRFCNSGKSYQFGQHREYYILSAFYLQNETLTYISLSNEPTDHLKIFTSRLYDKTGRFKSVNEYCCNLLAKQYKKFYMIQPGKKT